eukprot:scaffold9.g3108.t1
MHEGGGWTAAVVAHTVREADGLVGSHPGAVLQVSKLCQELQLPRGTVLQWLRDQPASPAEVPVPAAAPPASASDARLESSLAEARAAAEEAARQRQAILQQRPAPGAAGGQAAAAHPQPQGGGGGGPPPWRRAARDKPLGRQAEATLEMVYSKTAWPSDEVVANLWELHRIPRERVVEWFSQRRKRATAAAVRRKAGNGGSDGGKGSGGRSGGRRPGQARPAAKTDWDAEWGQGE